RPARRRRPRPDAQRAAAGRRRQAAGVPDRERLPTGLRAVRHHRRLDRERAQGCAAGDQPVVSMGGSLAWPWLLAAALLAVQLVGGWAWRTRKARSGATRWVAHTEYLEHIPALRRALRSYRLARAAGAAALVVALVSAGVLAARPVDRVVTEERFGTRDIVLCLDVSGSMVPFDSAIVDTFAEL